MGRTGLEMFLIRIPSDADFVCFRTAVPKGEDGMDNRLSVLSIIVEDRTSVAKINDYLHEWGEYIVGRMGLPYRERELSVICVVMDAPGDVTSALSGKLGMLPGVQVKTVTSKASMPPRKAAQ